MPAAKYKTYYQQMLTDNQELFDQFRVVHEAYVEAPHANQARFNDIGKDVLRVVQETEHRLCSHSERGMYARYSSKLAENFWKLVRADFPKINRVGVK